MKENIMTVVWSIVWLGAILLMGYTPATGKKEGGPPKKPPNRRHERH